MNIRDELGKPLIKEEEIDRRSHEIALQIALDCIDRKPVLLCVQKGAIVWASKVIQALGSLSFAFDLASISASSYEKTQSTGRVVVENLEGMAPKDLIDRHIIVLEDILDTLKTVKAIKKYLNGCGVSSVVVCSMLLKEKWSNFWWRVLGLRGLFGMPRAPYIGKTIKDRFVVGLGLDYEQWCRDLEGIFVMNSKVKEYIDAQVAQ